MNDLSSIGFYTLTNERANQASHLSPLWRNELIITSRCNFACPYCRGTDINGRNRDMTLAEIKHVIDFWADNDIKNVRFSGGEPTIHPNIREIISYTKQKCTSIEHIAISTNGYSDLDLYLELINLGVNDYSISLDACCSATGDKMAGNISGAWDKIVYNIQEISELTYVTVGVVLTEANVPELPKIVKFAHDLGVADIRLISAAQNDDISIFKDLDIPQQLLDKHPILAYRVNNFNTGRNVRGIKSCDSDKCGLILDDMIVKGKYHYPCVINMREGGLPIGEVNSNTRQDRKDYYDNFNPKLDNICNKNCLDVCIDYNNKFCKHNK